jgi:hypothetical protein
MSHLFHQHYHSSRHILPRLIHEGADISTNVDNKCMALASIYTSGVFRAEPTRSKSNVHEVASTFMQAHAAIRVLWGLEATPGVENPDEADFELPEQVILSSEAGYMQADDIPQFGEV